MARSEKTIVVEEVPAKSAAALLQEKVGALEKVRTQYQRAREMRDEQEMSASARVRDALLELIPELEKESAAELEVAAKAKAEARMLGVSRAYGSLASELQEDEARVREKLDEARAVVAALNTRYAKLQMLTAEAAALADRFAIERPALRAVTSPYDRKLDYRLPSPTRGSMPSPRLERCEHGLRQRRSYAEVAGTPAYDIIAEAGLKPYPPLSDRERHTVAARERERDEERRQMRQLPKIPDGIPSMGINL